MPSSTQHQIVHPIVLPKLRTIKRQKQLRIIKKQLLLVNSRRPLALQHAQTPKPKFSPKEPLKETYESYSASSDDNLSSTICEEYYRRRTRASWRAKVRCGSTCRFGLLGLGDHPGTYYETQDRYFETNKISTDDPDVLYDFYLLQKKTVTSFLI